MADWAKLLGEKQKAIRDELEKLRQKYGGRGAAGAFAESPLLNPGEVPEWYKGWGEAAARVGYEPPPQSRNLYQTLASRSPEYLKPSLTVVGTASQAVKNMLSATTEQVYEAADNPLTAAMFAVPGGGLVVPESEYLLGAGIGAAGNYARGVAPKVAKKSWETIVEMSKNELGGVRVPGKKTGLPGMGKETAGTKDLGAQVFDALTKQIETPARAVPNLTDANLQAALDYGRQQIVLTSRDKTYLRALEKESLGRTPPPVAPKAEAAQGVGEAPVSPVQPAKAAGERIVPPKAVEAPVPPVEPPKATGTVPPAKPPKKPPVATAVTPAPQAGQRIMGDLQNTDELVTTMSQDDWLRKAANLPGIRSVVKYLNPAGVANKPSQQAVVARAALREEGSTKAVGAFSTLERFGEREKVWGKVAADGKLTSGSLAGKSLDDVLTYRLKNAKDMTPEQKAWAEQFHNLEVEKLDLLKRNGIDINELSFTDGGEYVGRRVMGKVDDAGELIDAGYVGSPGPGRPGRKAGFEKTRVFKDINEALDEGYRYLPPDEALFLNIKAAYNKIADKQTTDWVLARIPWRTTASPEELMVARDVSRSALDGSRRLLQLLNRAVRGERISVNRELAAALPQETARLKALLPDLQAGKPTAAEVQSLTADLKTILKQKQTDFQAISRKVADARKSAMRSKLGEASVNAPAFTGKILTGKEARENAEILNRAFNAQYGDIDRIIMNVNKVNAIGRFFALAGDASVLGIQLIGFPFRYPKIYGKATVNFTKALFNAKSQAAYLAANNDIIQASRNLLLSKGGQTEFTEAFRSGGILTGKRWPGKALEPFQRGFEAAMDTAGIELRKAMNTLADTPKNTAEVEQFINEVRGITSSARLGVSPQLRQAETALTIAPRYNRAIAALLTDLVKKDIRGDQARKYIAALIGGGIAAGTAITLARGEGWEGVQRHLDLRSPDFMTWDVAGQRVGPGSKIRSLLALAGRIAESPEKSPELITRFLRAQASPVISTGIDIISGKDYIGEPTRPGENVGWKEGMLGLTRRVVADNLVPIWVQSAALDGGTVGERALRGAIEFGGGRSYPLETVSASYAYRWKPDFKAYKDIPTSDIERKAKKLPSRTQYRGKNPKIDAKLFVAGEVSSLQSNAAVLEVLKLIQENDIDPEAIKGVKAKREEMAKRAETGVKDTTITPTDVLMLRLKATAPKAAPSQTPAQESAAKVPVPAGGGGLSSGVKNPYR